MRSPDRPRTTRRRGASRNSRRAGSRHRLRGRGADRAALRWRSRVPSGARDEHDVPREHPERANTASRRRARPAPTGSHSSGAHGSDLPFQRCNPGAHASAVNQARGSAWHERPADARRDFQVEVVAVSPVEVGRERTLKSACVAASQGDFAAARRLLSVRGRARADACADESPSRRRANARPSFS